MEGWTSGARPDTTTGHGWSLCRGAEQTADGSSAAERGGVERSSPRPFAARCHVREIDSVPAGPRGPCGL